MEKKHLSIFSFSGYVAAILVTLFGVGFVLDFAIREAIIFNSEISGAYKVNRIIHELHPEEIPIFGSSRAQANFVPSVLGKNYYNYGIDGTQANVWLFFLEQELAKEKKTPIVINFDLSGLISSDGDLGNYIPNWKSTNEVLKDEGTYLYSLPLVRYFGKFESYLKYYLSNKFNLTKVTDHGGSFEKNRLTEKKFNELVKKRMATTREFRADEHLLAKFNKLVDSTDRVIVLVVSPYHDSYFNQFINIDEANDFLSKVQSKKNVRVLDMRSLELGNEKYINTMHLNYDGAKDFTSQVQNAFDSKSTLLR